MDITLRTLNQGEKHFCGYITCGDWRFCTNGDLEATVSQMDDPDAEFVVLLHELIEAYLCRKHGVSSQSVCAHDIMFEKERQLMQDMAEPGDDPRAPYRREHQFATMIEMAVLHELGGSWPDHCKEVADG